MAKENHIFQTISWVIFGIEMIFILIVPIVTYLHPKDPTVIPDNVFKMILSLYFLLIVVIFQVLTFFAIKYMKNTKWTIVLIIMGFVHDPLYLIPAIGELLLHLRNENSYGHI